MKKQFYNFFKKHEWDKMPIVLDILSKSVEPKFSTFKKNSLKNIATSTIEFMRNYSSFNEYSPLTVQSNIKNRICLQPNNKINRVKDVVIYFAKLVTEEDKNGHRTYSLKKRKLAPCLYTMVNCPWELKIDYISKINEYNVRVFISERNQNQNMSIITQELKGDLHRVIDIKCLKNKK